jgi:hypothetical protein
MLELAGDRFQVPNTSLVAIAMATSKRLSASISSQTGSRLMPTFRPQLVLEKFCEPPPNHKCVSDRRRLGTRVRAWVSDGVSCPADEGELVGEDGAPPLQDR